MNLSDFERSFWHPFGPHGRETPQEIIARKQSEIHANGWTLWSFQFRSMLTDWHRELQTSNGKGVLVFCSESKGAIDPARDGNKNSVINCQSFRFVDENKWQPTPNGVKVPHPFRPGKKLASAFVVQRIIYPIESYQRPAVEWFSPTKGPWCQTPVPTRGE